MAFFRGGSIVLWVKKVSNNQRKLVRSLTNLVIILMWRTRHDYSEPLTQRILFLSRWASRIRLIFTNHGGWTRGTTDTCRARANNRRWMNSVRTRWSCGDSPLTTHHPKSTSTTQIIQDSMSFMMAYRWKTTRTCRSARVSKWLASVLSNTGGTKYSRHWRTSVASRFCSRRTSMCFEVWYSTWPSLKTSRYLT